MQIKITKHLLTDYSEVFDVHIGPFRLHACTEKDANELAEAIAKAVNDYTVSDCTVIVAY